MSALKKHSISTIVSFCSLDLRFITHCIEAIRPFSSEILVPVCDHFYDGTKENLKLLKTLYQTFPDVKFIQFAYHPEYIYGIDEKKSISDLDWKRLQIASSRYIGYFFSRNSDYLLFLDCDEIIDSELFQKWLETKTYLEYDGIYFLAHAYFRKPIYQSINFQRTSLLVKKSKLSKNLILNPDERSGLFENLEGNKLYDTLSLSKTPMIHHYGWSRTKDELLKKTQCWGHHFEKDWKNLIEKEYSQDFSGKDFWSQSRYRILKAPIHDVMKPPFFKKKTSDTSHVEYICRESFFCLELKREFNL